MINDNIVGIGKGVGEGVGEGVDEGIGEDIGGAIGENVGRVTEEAVDEDIGENIGEAFGEDVGQVAKESVDESDAMLSEDSFRSLKTDDSDLEDNTDHVGTFSYDVNNPIMEVGAKYPNVVAKYKEAYASSIAPLPSCDQWVKIDIGHHVLPPILNRPAGRPQNKRIRGSDEMTIRKRHRCKRCNKLGHRAKICKNPVDANQQPAAGPSQAANQQPAAAPSQATNQQPIEPSQAGNPHSEPPSQASISNRTRAAASGSKLSPHELRLGFHGQWRPRRRPRSSGTAEEGCRRPEGCQECGLERRRRGEEAAGLPRTERVWGGLGWPRRRRRRVGAAAIGGKGRPGTGMSAGGFPGGGGALAAAATPLGQARPGLQQTAGAAAAAPGDGGGRRGRLPEHGEIQGEGLQEAQPRAFTQPERREGERKRWRKMESGWRGELRQPAACSGGRGARRGAGECGGGG
uniref:CCHC-type domain-containing protein n=1 Tax=Ananas comosus var. bracteatus TaxID=296719 RepID=A0A6V7QI00_ANACO|nr:unnamed protein product [Ananas comosus var. bracteatus]